MNQSEIADQNDSKTVFGFWVYLMTDCILFATLFATFAVLHNNTFGGEGAQQIVKLPYVLAQTLILLTSSFTCGLALLAARRDDRNKVIDWFGITFLLGLAFLVLEVNEFGQLVYEGNSWRNSGFLSSFFTLVGTHGLHITAGLLWMATMIIRVARLGLDGVNLRRLTCLALFWHFLDIIWIFIFSLVYLLGVV